MTNFCVTVADIREVIKSYLNCKILIEAHRSKKKVYQKEAIIKAAYSNIFIIELLNAEGMNNRLSFCYSDLLTKSVRIILTEGHNEVLDLLNED